MSKLALAVGSLLFVIAVMTGGAWAAVPGCGPEDLINTAAAIDGLQKSVAAAASAGNVDVALSMVQKFDTYPLAPEGAEARLSVATALRKVGRFKEAADLLRKNDKTDPFNAIAPDSLALLADILQFDLNVNPEAYNTLLRLATGYYPGFPAVARARARFGQKLPDVPVLKKVLLDTSLGGASIHGRSQAGDSNFGQWDVAKELSSAGYTVHHNGTKNYSCLENPTVDTLGQYGLVMETGCKSSCPPAIPDALIDAFVNYVQGGGKLIVCCSGQCLGSNHCAQYIDPLMSKFGITFEEGTDVGHKGTTQPGTLKGRTEFSNLKGFDTTFAVKVIGGDAFGFVGETPVIAEINYGRGKVIAAGIGTGFQGNTMGVLHRKTPEQLAQTQKNKDFLVALVRYAIR